MLVWLNYLAHERCEYRKCKYRNKFKITLDLFFVLVFLMVLYLFPPISVFSISQLPIHGTCAEGNSKNGNSEDTSKNIFRDRKKYKNYKTKNVSSVVIICNVSIFCIFVFPTFVSNEVQQLLI